MAAKKKRARRRHEYTSAEVAAAAGRLLRWTRQLGNKIVGRVPRLNETKATCLWLKGLPLLTPTNVVSGRRARVHMEPPGPDRWKNRSRTYRGIAEAMADQWSVQHPDDLL